MSNSVLSTRREYLGGLVLGLASGVAGCAQSGGTTRRAFEIESDLPCAQHLRILERSARIGTGTVPEIELQLRNTGDILVGYELRVTFQQATSIGNDVPTGGETLSGTVPAGNTVVRTATDDAYEIENTDSYELATSVSCPE